MRAVTAGTAGWRRQRCAALPVHRAGHFQPPACAPPVALCPWGTGRHGSSSRSRHGVRFARQPCAPTPQLRPPSSAHPVAPPRPRPPLRPPPRAPPVTTSLSQTPSSTERACRCVGDWREAGEEGRAGEHAARRGKRPGALRYPSPSQNPSQAYVSYKIQTKTDSPAFRGGTAEVIRRYRDFAWLAARLGRMQRGTIVPPLPEKSVVQKYQMSAEFVEARRAALQVFLGRVVRGGGER